MLPHIFKQCGEWKIWVPLIKESYRIFNFIEYPSWRHAFDAVKFLDEKGATLRP